MDRRSAESVIEVEIEQDGEKKNVQHTVESVVCMITEREGENKQVKYLARFKNQNGLPYFAIVKEAFARLKFPSFVKEFEDESQFFSYTHRFSGVFFA